MGRGRGFTMIEAVTATTILMLVVGAVVSFNLWGLAMSARSQIWLSAGEDARNSLRMMHGDIRAAVTIQVGSGNSFGFTNVGMTNLQVGNALQIWTNTDPNNWIRYFYLSNTLYRTNCIDSNTPGDLKIVSANSITNDNPSGFIFALQNYQGQTLSNVTTTPYPMVNIYLSFTQLNHPQITIAPGNPVDFYQINTVVAPRQRP